MLRRVLVLVSKKVEKFMMAEGAISQAAASEITAGKRPLTEDDNPSPLAKKPKVQDAAPVQGQGRVDRKRKVALLIAYCGAGYYGIQIQMNGNFQTIESEVLKALVAAELVPQGHADTPKKMSLQRSARTDKNVSAVGNVLSLKTVPEEINSHLPPEIRVMGCIRTTQSFDSKVQCTFRTYKYMLPTYSFAPVEKYITKDYRLAEGAVDRVNEVLGKYVGTHDFHNFTSGRKPNEDSSKRYIKMFTCGEPFVRDGMEFVILTVKGQSFMLHHIRKMIGLMIAIVRGFCGDDVLTKSWGPQKMDIPKAPGLGLFLNELFFDGYNKKFGNDGLHEPLVWDKYREALDQFKERHVLSHIARSELQESVMLQWLATLQYHKFDVIDPNEEVPPDGEKARSWFKTKALLRKMDKEQKTTEAEAASADQGGVVAANNSANSTCDLSVSTAGSEQTSQEDSMITTGSGDTTSMSVADESEPMATDVSTDAPSAEQVSVLQEVSAVSDEPKDASISPVEQASLQQEKPAVTVEAGHTPAANSEPSAAVAALQEEDTVGGEQQGADTAGGDKQGADTVTGEKQGADTVSGDKQGADAVTGEKQGADTAGGEK